MNKPESGQQKTFLASLSTKRLSLLNNPLFFKRFPDFTLQTRRAVPGRVG
jgi:hypothetical protein